MEIEKLRQYLELKKIKWSVHCMEKLQERDISRADVKRCIEFGEIIEEYRDDFPHPSALVFGHTVNNSILHVVVGEDGRFLYIITAYYPNTMKFEDDLKTRRRG